MTRVASIAIVAASLVTVLVASAQAPGPEMYPHVADEFKALDFEETKVLAEQGNAGAQYKLGLIYVNGDGVPQDYSHAHMWLNIAALQSYAYAAFNRDVAAALMRPDQITEARAMARRCVASNYADC